MGIRNIGRRRFLMGASTAGVAAVGLPLFDALLNGNGNAFAQTGDPLPRRVGCWFWGNGLRPEHFFPAGAEYNEIAVGERGTVNPWDPAGKQHTKPLADAGLQRYLSLVTGTVVAARPEQAHHDGKNAVLTGSYEWFEGDPDRGYAGPITPSFDQVAANYFEGQTPFKSLVLGVQEGAANNEPGNAGHFTSSTGRNAFIRPEYSPLALYTRLFLDGSGADPGGDEEAAARLLMARRSILDAVMDDVNKLNADLGARDKMCLDQHLTTIRQLEQRLGDGLDGSCSAGGPPNDWPTVDGMQRLRDRSKSMSDVLALALACDMTRAFSYQFTVFQTGHDFAQEPELNGTVPTVDPDQQLELETSFHEAAHFEEFQDAVRIVTNFTFDNLAYTLSKLAEIPEGEGTVLSNSAIVATSEHTEPMSHNTRDIPLIIAGLAGGNLKGELWYHGDDEKCAKAGLTVLRASGVEIERFGTDFENPDTRDRNDPSTTETFTALEG